MKRPVVKYVLETVIPKLREVGESLSYLQVMRKEKLYYGKYSIQHIKKKHEFDLVSDINEVSPEDVVSRGGLLQCLRADLYAITFYCAYHNAGVDLISETKLLYEVLPNIKFGSRLDNGGELISLTARFEKELALKMSSKEMNSRITYILGDNVYFKDVIEFAYHYRNSLMKFG